MKTCHKANVPVLSFGVDDAEEVSAKVIFVLISLLIERCCRESCYWLMKTRRSDRRVPASRRQQENVDDRSTPFVFVGRSARPVKMGVGGRGGDVRTVQ